MDVNLQAEAATASVSQSKNGKSAQTGTVSSTLSVAELNKLSSSKLSKLNATALNKLNVSQLSKLSAAQLEKVSDAKLKTLPAATLAKLSASKLQSLGVENKNVEKVTISEEAKKANQTDINSKMV